MKFKKIWVCESKLQRKIMRKHADYTSLEILGMPYDLKPRDESK